MLADDCVECMGDAVVVPGVQVHSDEEVVQPSDPDNDPDFFFDTVGSD